MASEHQTEKFPIPVLDVTAYTAKQPKKKKSLEERKNAKRLKDVRRAKTRINIGSSHSSWRNLRDCLGLTLDSQLAALLLDFYQKFTKVTSSQKQGNSTSKSLNVLESDKEEKPSLTSLKSVSHSVLSGPVLKCPACGFVLKVQHGKEAHQPQSIEVTLELEETEEPVSGAEEANQSNGEIKEEEMSEGSGVEQWKEEEGSEGSGVEQSNGGEDSDNDWTPELWHQTTHQKEEAVREEESRGETEPKRKKQLCTECGEFYKKSHKCDHKTRPVVCNACGRRFISESALKVHSYMHSETHEYLCKYCYASFKTKVNKLAHELIHLKQKDPFKCPDCAMTFPTFRKRAAHKKEHKKDKFKCKICGIELYDEQSFMRHIVVHSGERPFKCFVCDMGFKQESHLKSHMRLHTGERPYSCKHCQKSFNHNVSLKSHVQKYHPEEKEKQERTEQAAEGQTTVKAKSKRPPTGRPRGRPKRNADEKKLKTKQETDEYESDEDYVWSEVGLDDFAPLN
ncbi:hypothetical protein NQD34_001575 [Periophthalmus magnuspinnatus]|nr:hypothetical protein NQD34_001575 [Periophthalmus magnuspinnatus]